MTKFTSAVTTDGTIRQPFVATCVKCHERIYFDIDPAGTPGFNGDWGNGYGDYGCAIDNGDDSEDGNGHVPRNIRYSRKLYPRPEQAKEEFLIARHTGAAFGMECAMKNQQPTEDRIQLAWDQAQEEAVIDLNESHMRIFREGFNEGWKFRIDSQIAEAFKAIEFFIHDYGVMSKEFCTQLSTADTQSPFGFRGDFFLGD